jgi:hypothetical protein
MEVPIEQETVLQQIHIDNTDVSFCRIKGPPPITVEHAITYCFRTAVCFDLAICLGT